MSKKYIPINLGEIEMNLPTKEPTALAENTCPTGGTLIGAIPAGARALDFQLRAYAYNKFVSDTFVKRLDISIFKLLRLSDAGNALITGYYNSPYHITQPTYVYLAISDAKLYITGGANNGSDDMAVSSGSSAVAPLSKLYAIYTNSLSPYSHRISVTFY